MLCFYHSGDLDGKCSGAIIKYFNPSCELIPFDHGRTFPWDKIKNQIVYMVDMSLNTIEEMKRISNSCIEFIWIDHHAVIINESNRQNFNPNGKRENGVAACELTWMFESERNSTKNCPPKQMPKTVWLLGRYDIWDLEADKDIIPFQLSMKAKGMDPRISMEYWEYIFKTNKDVHNMVNKGRAIHEYMIQENENFMNHYSIDTELTGLRVLAVNRQPVNSALFESHWDNEKYDLMLGFCRFKNNKNGYLWKISMFTDKPGINVGEIAKKLGDYYGLGGGGHVQAAGFIVPGEFDNLPFEV